MCKLRVVCGCRWIMGCPAKTGSARHAVRHVTFFPLSWTVVHPITPESPLWGMTEEELLAADAEFFILLKGLDETFSQEVHTRSSYKAEELVWGARFVNVFHLDREDGRLGVDITRIHEYERVG